MNTHDGRLVFDLGAERELGAMIEDMVSTIIPVYNRSEMLREAVESVLTQTWRPVEIIIVDDGSTDDTAQAAEELKAKHPDNIRVLRQRNAGPGVARQLGFELSRGEFIQFLDSDDLLMPRKFELQVQGLRKDTEAGISYCYCLEQRGTGGEPVVTHGTELRHRYIFPAALKERIWPTLAPLYRRSVCEAIGPWSPRRILEDWDYDCRAGVLGVRLHYCEDVLALIRIHSGTHAGLEWQKDEHALRDYVGAYLDILAYAKAAEIPMQSLEMQSFVRSLFFMARTAGKHGLSREAQQLFASARSNAIDPGWDYRLFHIATTLVGWKWASHLAETTRRLRK